MLTLYGLKISYFTGKMEAYLRAKQIPCRAVRQGLFGGAS